MRVIKAFLIFTLFCSTILFANNSREYERAQEYLKKHGVVYFTFPMSPSTDLNKLTEIVSLSHREGTLMHAIANPREFDLFLQENIYYEVERMPGEDYDPSHMYEGDLNDFTGQKLLNYDKYVELMEKHAKDYPEVCKLYEIGTSIKGKKMLCLRITKDLPSTGYTKKPRFLFGCAVHGDELNGTMFSYRLMDLLLKGYKRGDPLAGKYLDGLEIWVAPHLNPDGTFPNGNTMSGAKRANSAGQDLNRDYPAPKLNRDEYVKALSRAQKETQNSIKFETEHQFNYTLDYHDGMVAIVCHWSLNKTKPVDMGWMRYAGGKYGGLKVGQAAVDWYPATGTRMDWQPFYAHTWGFTVEVGKQGTNPNGSWERHKSGIFAMFDEAMCGIRGIVSDASGKGVGKCKVLLKQNGKVWDKHGSESYSHGTGFYVHYAPAGTYDVEFSCNGKTQTKTGITVVNGKPTPLDVNIDGVTSMQNTTAVSYSGVTFMQMNRGIKINWHGSPSAVLVTLYNVDGSYITSIQPEANSSSVVWDGSINKTTATSGCYIAKVNVDGEINHKKFLLNR